MSATPFHFTDLAPATAGAESAHKSNALSGPVSPLGASFLPAQALNTAHGAHEAGFF